MRRFALCVSLIVAMCSSVCMAEDVFLTEDNAGAVSGVFACHPGGMAPGATAQQSFYRAFKLNTFLSPTSTPYLEVDNVGFAVGNATSNSGKGQSITVNLYTTSAVPPTLASMKLVSSTVVNIPDESSAFATATFASSPIFTVASDTLVVEIASPDTNYFAMGTTSVSQTAPSYFRAAACAANEPTDTSSYGAVYFPITASGQTRTPTPVQLQSYGID